MLFLPLSEHFHVSLSMPVPLAHPFSRLDTYFRWQFVGFVFLFADEHIVMYVCAVCVCVCVFRVKRDRKEVVRSTTVTCHSQLHIISTVKPRT